MTPPISDRSRRRSRARLLLAPLVVAAGAFTPVAARAVGPPPFRSVVELVPPTPEAGTPLTGVQHVKVEASALGIVRSVHVAVHSDDPSIPAFESHVDRRLDAPLQAVFEVDWDTRTPTHNGVYRLEASAETCTASRMGATCGSVDTKRPGLLVANPPATPDGVHAEYRDNVPVVSWNAGGEADLLGYQVLRSAGGGPAPVGSVRAGEPTSFVDTQAPTGVGLSYSVVAVRRSPVAATADQCRFFNARCTVSTPSTRTPMIAAPVVTAPAPDPAPAPAPPDGVTIDPGPSDTAVAPPAAPPAAPAPAPAPAANRITAPAQRPSQPSVPTTSGARPTTSAAPASGPVEQARVAENPPVPQDAQVQGLQLAPPVASDPAAAPHDRLEPSKPDHTAAVLTVILLGLGLLAAHKAKRILRPTQHPSR